MPLYFSLVTEAFMETYLWVRYCPELVDLLSSSVGKEHTFLQPKGGFMAYKKFQKAS